jgi:hypothetical protein
MDFQIKAIFVQIKVKKMEMPDIRPGSYNTQSRNFLEIFGE